MESENAFELIIIGGGPAGLSSGIFSGHYALSTLILTETLGGQAKLAPEIINYPGVTSTKGSDWLASALAQIQLTSTKIVESEVNSVELQTKTDDPEPQYLVTTKQSSYLASSLIFAVGNKRRRPNYTGAEIAASLGVKLSSDNLIQTDNFLQTNLKGVFAAGNCLAYPNGLEQLSLAASQGILAASQAYEYLRKQKPPVIWGKAKIPSF